MLERVWRKGTLLHCWWECKLVQLQWWTVESPSKTGNRTAIWPSNPSAGEFKLKDSCISMFISGLFTIARTWKPPRCPLADEWIKKLWYIYTVEYYSAIKRNAFESVLMGWMNLEPIIQRSKSERERQILYINAYIWNLEIWYQWSYLQGSKGDTHIKNRLLDSVRESEGGMIWENSIEICTLSYVK